MKKKIAILRIRQGDSEAFGYIYDLYIEKIYRFIYFRISDQSTAHDISQEVFLKTWEHIVDNKKIDRLQSFIYKIAYNKVVDYYRAKNRQVQLLDDISESKIDTDSIDATGAEMNLLMRQIRKLKAEYQDVIILKHVNGMSIKEIAEITSKDSNNVRVTLHRAMSSLKKIYKDLDKKTKDKSRN